MKNRYINILLIVITIGLFLSLMFLININKSYNPFVCDNDNPFCIGNIRASQIYYNTSWHNPNTITELSTGIYSFDPLPPTYKNLKESSNPLELGFNETISLEVYCNDTILFVYIEIENVNYSMTNHTLNLYSYTWNPIHIGIISYTIYMMSIYNKLAIVSGYILVQFIPIIMFSIIILSLMSLTALYFWIKFKSSIDKFLIMLNITLFGFIFGLLALNINAIPFTPYFQLFFIVFNLIFLLETSLEFNEYRKQKRKKYHV